ncbi:hypothetical protein AC249_AIPGENE5037, partial [Exaiptasia diaphana]
KTEHHMVEYCKFTNLSQIFKKFKFDISEAKKQRTPNQMK